MRARKKCITRFICQAIVVCGFSLVLAGCGGGGGPAQEQAYFLALPFSNENRWECMANGISDDGTTVVGQCADENGELEPVRWVNGKIKRLGFMSDIPGVSKNAFAYGVSNNGIVIGNQGYKDLTPQAYYYKDGNWHRIVNPATGIQVTTPSGISSDGRVIVRHNDFVIHVHSGAFYFEPLDGKFFKLPSVFSVEYDCSAAGVTCVNGFNAIDGACKTAVVYDSISSTSGSIPPQTRPLLYKIAAGQAPVLLPLPDSFRMGKVWAISRKGSFMAGGTEDPWMPVVAVYWDNNYKVYTIGSLGPDTVRRDSIAYGVSDGGVAVGQSNLQAFIFDNKSGLRALADYLTTLGLGDQIKGWSLYRASAITPDGRYVVGSGRNGSGYQQAFLIYLPR